MDESEKGGKEKRKGSRKNVLSGLVGGRVALQAGAIYCSLWWASDQAGLPQTRRLSD